ncbi:hypothetical protein [Xanthovirga aplysinae]|uniref:hypothetical protein n=1 Tax=Xanthovirga aplysinae TaxID=2529853 RepID=UPI0012BCEA2B|nr:hypothetical protein [Xanthovirga aplysinae]MTI32309.1 hypothetical protein [Xanthovirga aplysinae]
MKNQPNSGQKKWIIALGVLVGAFLLFDIASNAYIEHQQQRNKLEITQASFQGSTSKDCFKFLDGKLYQTTKLKVKSSVIFYGR